MDLELKRYYNNLLYKAEKKENDKDDKNIMNGRMMYNLVIGNKSADLDSIVSAITYSRILNLINNTINFDENNKIYGIHLPVINCNRNELKLKFPLIALINYFSNNQDNDSGDDFQIENMPFICLDDDIINELILEMEKFDNEKKNVNFGHYITLVDHNTLDTFQKNFNERVVSIVDHHQDYMTTKSNYRLSLGTDIGSCSTLIGKIWRDSYGKGKINQQTLIENKIFLEMIVCTILKDTCNFKQELLGKRWSSLDLEVYNWIIEILSLIEKNNEEIISKKYTDLYLNFLKNANRNIDIIFNNELIELFKMDYKDFIYNNKFGNEDIIVGYSKNFQTDIKNFILNNKLNLFIILSNYIYKTEDHQNEEIKKQIIISYINNDHSQVQNLHNLIIKCLETTIPVIEIKMESVITEFNIPELSFKLFNIHDMSFSRKKLEPFVKDIINNNL
ncbi:DDH domain containing protein [Cryptosporidium tyzzeri]|nr:DDH domain containing protein [Cryptosporidium tyzzeri]